MGVTEAVSVKEDEDGPGLQLQSERGKPSHRKPALYSTWPFKVKNSPKLFSLGNWAKIQSHLKLQGEQGEAMSENTLYGKLKEIPNTFKSAVQ